MTGALNFTGPKRELLDGWAREVVIGDQKYACRVKRGESVRIPYKPRGKNRGWIWYGSVYRMSEPFGRLWEDRVPSSIGCRGLLSRAGLLEAPQ